jgi:hypothetical protein
VRHYSGSIDVIQKIWGYNAEHSRKEKLTWWVGVRVGDSP